MSDEKTITIRPTADFREIDPLAGAFFFVSRKDYLENSLIWHKLINIGRLPHVTVHEPKQKPKTAEEWVKERDILMTKDSVRFFQGDLPPEISSALGLDDDASHHIAKKMFLIALEKVLRDSGEIE